MAKFTINFEDADVSLTDVKAVISNSPLDLGWFTIQEDHES